MILMRKVFVDTAAWIALINVDDRLHEQAETIMAQLRRDRSFAVSPRRPLSPSPRSHPELVEGSPPLPLSSSAFMRSLSKPMLSLSKPMLSLSKPMLSLSKHACGVI